MSSFLSCSERSSDSFSKEERTSWEYPFSSEIIWTARIAVLLTSVTAPAASIDQNQSKQICQSLSRDNLGIAIDLKVTGSDDRITVQDVAGVTHVIDATDGSKLVNKMARDYWFNSSRTSATEIYTSSFCAVHEISEPFYVYASKKFNDAWSSREAMARSLNEYKELKKQNKL